MKISRTPALLITLTLAGLLLSGCGTTTDTNTAPVATSSTTAPVEAVTTPAPIEVVAPVTGAVLTAAQAEALPDGQAAYALADGSLVLVTATEPLPAPVAAAIQATADAAYTAGDTVSRSKAKDAASRASIDTGKKVLIVHALTGTWSNETMAVASHKVWGVAGAVIKAPLDGWTWDECVAAAQAFINASADASIYALVVQAN